MSTVFTLWLTAQQLDPHNPAYEVALQAVAERRLPAQPAAPEPVPEAASPLASATWADELALLFQEALADAQPELHICTNIHFNLAPVDEPAFIMAPDIAFVASDRIPTDAAPDDPWSLVPDVTLDIAPSDAAPDAMHDRARTWLAHGVQLVWLMWPETASIEVWQPAHDAATQVLGIGDTLDGGDVIAHLALPLATLFPEKNTPAP